MTTMKRNGYRFYVYNGPGMIEYFRTREEAESRAEETGGRIGEVDQ